MEVTKNVPIYMYNILVIVNTSHKKAKIVI